MKDKIKEFINVHNPSFSEQENIMLLNRSNYNDNICQAIFYSIDESSKKAVCDLHNTNGDKLFSSNQLNIVSDESSIEKLILGSIEGLENSVLNNPELIYRAFNFIRPSSLLPNFQTKLNLIKQKGISELGIEKNYVLNPYFLGFKISLDIYLTTIFCYDYHEAIAEGLVKIFVDKYGEDYEILFQNITDVAIQAVKEDEEQNGQNDDILISALHGISGIYDKEIFNNLIYVPGVAAAEARAAILSGQ